MNQEIMLAIQERYDHDIHPPKKKISWFCCRKSAQIQAESETDPEEAAKERWRKVATLRYLLASLQMYFLFRAKDKALDMELKMYEGEAGENFEDELKKSRKWMIYPWKTWKVIWDFLVIMLKLYFCFSVPYKLSFFSEKENRNPLTIDEFLNLFLIMDIILKFFTPYLNDLALVEDFGKIAKHYLKREFAIDFLAVFPFFVINGHLLWLRMGRLVQVRTLTNRIENSVKFIQSVISAITPQHSVIEWQNKVYAGRMLRFLFYLATISHFVACMFHLLVKSENDEDSKLITEDKMNEEIYVAALYWTITTFSTVGYGDISAVTNNEMIFVMAVELVGILFFAYLLGNVTSIITALNERENALTEKETDLDKWLMKLDSNRADAKMDRALLSNIRNFFTYVWQNDHSYLLRETDFMMMLPLDLRKQLTEFLFRDEAKDYGVFFENCPDEFKYEIVLNMYPRRYKENEEIIEKGSIVKEMYFLMKGHVVLSTKFGIQIFLRLPEKSYFGDDHIIFSTIPQMSYMEVLFRADIRGCECFTVTQEVLESLLERFPQALDNIGRRAFKRSSYFNAVMYVKISQDKLENSMDEEEPGAVFEECELAREDAAEYLKNFDFFGDLTPEEEDEYNRLLINRGNKVETEENSAKELDEATWRLNETKMDIEELYKKLKHLKMGYEGDLDVMSTAIKEFINEDKEAALNTLKKLRI